MAERFEKLELKYLEFCKKYGVSIEDNSIILDNTRIDFNVVIQEYNRKRKCESKKSGVIYHCKNEEAAFRLSAAIEDRLNVLVNEDMLIIAFIHLLDSDIRTGDICKDICKQIEEKVQSYLDSFNRVFKGIFTKLVCIVNYNVNYRV